MTSSKTVGSWLVLFIERAHRAKLRSIDVADLQEKFLILLRLIIRVGPREKLISIIFEVHGDLAEDPTAQMKSVIKVLCRGENDFSLLDISGIQIYRSLHRRKERSEFFL